MKALSLGSIFANEWQYLQNTEPVTLYRKLSDGQFDGGTAVANALRLEIGKEQAASGVGAKVGARLSWLLWSSQTNAPAVKTGDFVADGSGANWAVEKVEVQAWGARYLIRTVQER